MVAMGRTYPLRSGRFLLLTTVLKLEQTKRTDPRLLFRMQSHYSQPKGFVGRNICYAIIFDDLYFGHIVGGSATRFLPGRNEHLGITMSQLNSIVNNIFYNITPVDQKYPKRNFTTFVLKSFVQQIQKDWRDKYGDTVLGFESLVEKPRSGELYKKAGWVMVGETIGYTCKRIAGIGTDSWGGKRIWNKERESLRPKNVFCLKVG